MKRIRPVLRGPFPVVAFCAIVAACNVAAACSIPVFRYALERWRPDYYEVVVLHRGPLGESDEQLVEKMRMASTDEKKPANLGVVLVDLDKLADAEEGSGPPKELVEKYADLQSPELLVHYPPYGPNRWQAWTGPLNADSVQRLIDSPLRQQIVKRLLAGDSSVWVMIDSGDEKKDAEAEATLRRDLARMEEALELPPQEVLQAEQEYQPLTQVELRIGFTLLRLRRDDPQEQIFLSMLLNSEPDLADFEEPIAIPIFGRGRTFFALVGKGINTENIEDNCYFICGDCSCQIKEQNPGMDMLMAVNWDEGVMGSAFPDVSLPELTGIGGLEIVDLTTSTESNKKEEAAEPETEVDTEEEVSQTAQTVAVDQVVVEQEKTEKSPALAMASPDSLSADSALSEPHLSGDVPAPLESDGQFGSRLLMWILAGAAVAAAVIVSSSFWMRSRQQL
jgi:hypothetical protein